MSSRPVHELAAEHRTRREHREAVADGLVILAIIGLTVWLNWPG